MTTIFSKADREAAAKVLEGWSASSSIRCAQIAAEMLNAAEASMKARGAMREGFGNWETNGGTIFHNTTKLGGNNAEPLVIIRLDKEGDT